MNLRTWNDIGYTIDPKWGIRKGTNSIMKMVELAKAEREVLIAENTPKMNYGLSRNIENLEERYVLDIEQNKGFDIDLTVDYEALTDEAKLREQDSLFSSKFGQYSKDNIIYMCDCGTVSGEVSGVKCNHCGSYTDKRVYKRGWIKLENGFKVFNPDYLNLLLQHIDSKKVGVSKKYVEMNLDDTKGECRYSLLALLDRSRLVEFIDMFIVENMKEFFLVNIDKALTNRIPVISFNYRFYHVDKTLNVDKQKVNTHRYNKFYIAMSNTARNLNNLDCMASFASKSTLLKHFTNQWKLLYAAVIEDLGKDKKKALLRGKTSGRYKHASAKCVIEAGKNLEIDECILSYKVFGIIVTRFFKKDLKELGLQSEGFTRLSRATPSCFDEIILNKLLDKLKSEGKNITTVLRAPSIYRTSIVGLKIISLSRRDVIQLHDVVIGPCVAGDKDGDTGIVCMPNPRIMASLFMAYHPSKGIWSSVTGNIKEDYELPESNYYLAYALFKPGSGRKLTDSGLSPTLVDPKKLGLVRDTSRIIA